MKDKNILVLCLILFLCLSCKPKKTGEETKPSEPTPREDPGAVEEAPPAAEDEAAKRDKLDGGPFPALFITQSRFLPAEDGSGKNTRPGPARLIILRKAPSGWQQVMVDDPDSNVFHKALQIEGSILTAGAMGAFLKLWSFKDGAWSAETIWNPKFGGKFDRLRDFETGRVMPDGDPQVAIATHDQGVVAVAAFRDGAWEVMEIDKNPDTFVHEIELGDFNGDGLNEIFATPSQPNKVGVSQAGEVVRYSWDGKAFEKSLVVRFETRHMKEILAVTLEGDKGPTLFAAVEAELEKIAGKARIKTPVEIVRFTFDASGKAASETVASIPDAQCRFLVAGDVDGDGKTELVAAAMKTGLWLLRPGDATPWKAENFDKSSSGFEHAAALADLDGNGKLELYVAADDQKSFNKYEWNGSGFDKQSVIPLGDSVITWNITAGSL
jgi:hypothetical protein